MTLRESIFQRGVIRGYDIAHMTDVPLLGSAVPDSLSGVAPDRIENVSTAWLVFDTMAHIAEETDRQNSPFEFIANALNELQQTAEFDVWDTFEEGVHEGVRQNWIDRVDESSKNPFQEQYHDQSASQGYQARDAG